MSNLYVLAIICFVGMLSPGPDFILVTRNSLRYPKLQALATAAGIITGSIVGASCCVLGLALIVTKSVLLFSFIKYAGALYLIYLGVKGLTSHSSSINLDQHSVNIKKISTTNAFVQGFLCNILNPKLAVFLLSLFTQFLSADSTFSDKLTVAGVFVLEAIIYWPILVLILQSKSVQLLFSKLQSVLDKVFGTILVGLGLKVAFTKD